MSNIERITGAVQAATTGIKTAQDRAAAADRQAEEVGRRAAAAGFGGIAAGVSGVRKDLGEIRQRLAALSTPLGETGSAVTAAPKEAAPEQTIAALTPAQQRLDTARQGTGGVVMKIDETKQTVNRVLQGGQPGPLLAALDAVRQAVLQGRQQMDVAKQEVDAAISEARQIGSSGN